ncbi:gag-pol polyprotein [Tanacetum coccineum]
MERQKKVSFDLTAGSSRRHSHSDVLDSMKSRYPCIYQPVNPTADVAIPKDEEEEEYNEDRRFLIPLYVFGARDIYGPDSPLPPIYLVMANSATPTPKWELLDYMVIGFQKHLVYLLYWIHVGFGLASGRACLRVCVSTGRGDNLVTGFLILGLFDLLVTTRIGWIYRSVIEDVLTRFRMHVRGWMSIYCMPSRPIQFIVLLSILDCLGHAHQWTYGFVNFLLSTHCPIWHRLYNGYLRFLERRAYINNAAYPFMSIALLTGKFVTPGVSMSQNVEPRVSANFSQDVIANSVDITEDSTRFDIFSSNHRKRARQQAYPTLSLGKEATLLKFANVNTVENAQPIRNGATNSTFTTQKVIISVQISQFYGYHYASVLIFLVHFLCLRPDCRDVGTSVLDQRKRKRENIQSMSVASEDAPSNRLRKSTAIVGKDDFAELRFVVGKAAVLLTMEIDTRPNGDALSKCILQDPYTPFTVTIPVVPATDDTLAVPKQTTVETILNMSPKNKGHYESEKESIHLLLTRIGDEIYSTVDACKTAHEMWIAIERLQQGESLNIKDVKTNLF